MNRIKKFFTKAERMDILINNAIVVNQYKNLFLSSNECGTCNRRIYGKEVIVSLTTYGNKIHNCYLAVESLLHQTYKPSKIILWLDEKIYNERDYIPQTLLIQEKRGLEIRLCRDVRSYTKVIHAISSFPNDLIISVDDDIIYPIDFVERLLKAYKKQPQDIHFYRGHKIVLKDGYPDVYSSWVKKGASGNDIFNVPTGVGGILYPPGCFHEDVCNADIFLSLCPTADDIWLKVMTLLKGVNCNILPSPIDRDKLFIPIDINNEESLQTINVVGGQNDIQIKKLFDKYGLKKILSNGG